MDAEQAVEVLDQEAVADEQQAQDDLHAEADALGERDGVVDESYVEHQDAGQQRGEDPGAADEAAGEQHARQDGETDHDAAHHGYRRILQLPGVGVVRNMLDLGKLEDVGVRPKGDAERNHCAEDGN